MPVRGTPIVTAGQFIQALQSAAHSHSRMFPLRNVIVTGDIDVEIDVFPEGLRLRQIVFENKLTLRGCHFDDEFSLVDCSFREGLDISGASFGAAVTIMGGVFGTPGVPSDERRLTMDFAEFRGDVDLVGLEIFGAVSGHRCMIRGSLICMSLGITAIGQSRPPLDLADTEIQGNFSINAFTDERINRLTLSDTFSLAHHKSRRHLEGDTTIRYTTNSGREAVSFRNMDVRGYFSLIGLNCQGPVDCLSAKFGSINAALAVIGGDFTLSGVSTKYITALGISVGGSLIMISGQSGQINIDDFISEDGYRREARIGALVMSSWVCTEWARFGISHVGHEQGVSPSFGVRGIEITDCRIQADLDFRCGKGAMRGLNVALPPEVTLSTCWFGGLRTEHRVAVTRTVVGGDIQLANLRTESIVDLSGTSASRIRFASPLSELADDTQRDPDYMALSHLSFFLKSGDMKPEHREKLGARARQLFMRQVSAGDIDLTGLRLVEEAAIGESGSVVASYTSISRELQVVSRAYAADQNGYVDNFLQLFPKGLVVDQALAAPIASRIDRIFKEVLRAPLVNQGVVNYVRQTLNEKTRVAAANVPGALRLENCRMGRLRLSADIFEDNPAASTQPTAGSNLPARRGIELENATVGELFVYRPSAYSQGQGNGFPRPVNLRGLAVTSWRLEYDVSSRATRRSGTAHVSEPSESDESGPYLDLLDNDSEYRASTYLSIERGLRDRGHDRAAREVFAAGRYRSHRAEFSPGSRFSWRPGHGRLRHTPLFPLFRMTRPFGETGESLILFVAVLLLSIIVLVNVRDWAVRPPARGLAILIGLALLLVILPLALRGLAEPFARLFDRMYWTFLDYGTSAWRLLFGIFALLSVSFVLVATESRNFEPTASAALAMKLATKFEAPCQPGKTWGTAEAFWMTLRYHVPLVNFGVMEDCQPGDGPLKLRYVVDDATPPRWWTRYIGRWPSGSDWFGLMSLLNYILWPLFIPFLLQRIFRSDRRS